MKHWILISVLFLVPQLVCAQKKKINSYAVIDRKALRIPDSLTRTPEGIARYVTTNFKHDNDRARAIFTWIASNIQYDINHQFTFSFFESDEEKISKPLKNRRGVCENYAALFNDVCLKSGMRSFVIEGYTKQNSSVDYNSHAWCAVLIDGSWFMFDPTWGSGFISNGKFFRNLNNNYFKVDPSSFIKSHMPFDFLWQFLNYPVTSREFYESKTGEDKSKPFFSYADSIQVYEKLDLVEQLTTSVDRIERSGVKSSLIYERLVNMKLTIERTREIYVYKSYNAALSDYTKGINLFEEFRHHRYKQFALQKTDSEIQIMLDTARQKLNEACERLKGIKNPNATAISTISKLSTLINEALRRVKDQELWLKAYFGKGELERKAMFYETRVASFDVHGKQ